MYYIGQVGADEAPPLSDHRKDGWLYPVFVWPVLARGWLMRVPSFTDAQFVYICNVLDWFSCLMPWTELGYSLFKIQAADPSYNVETRSASSNRVCARYLVPPSTYMKRDSLFPQIDQTHRQYASGLATGRGAAVPLPARFWRAQPTDQRIAHAPRRWKTVAVSRHSVKISTELGKAPAGDGSCSSALAARFSTSAGSCAAETRLPSPMTVSED